MLKFVKTFYLVEKTYLNKIVIEERKISILVEKLKFFKLRNIKKNYQSVKIKICICFSRNLKNIFIN